MGGNTIIERRRMLQELASMLAQGLEGEGRATFEANAATIINRSAPAVGREQMRAYLKANVID